ncbi:MAG: RES family NAD+ phosphorylase [Acidimicrobiales bacterium]
MSGGIDEQLLDAVNTIGPTTWSGRSFRYTTARRDPLSGEGARLHGGRWNPPDLFPVIYLAVPATTCMLELEIAAADNHIDVATQLQVPYKLHTIRVDDIAVLDLRDMQTQANLGLEPDDLSGPWDACQPIGHAAWFLELAGVLAPSATGVGLTLALFEHRAKPEQIHVEGSQPLTLDLYRRHVS